ncbi:biotin/lipoyl-containing protein, partial [Actinotalea ferrariae]|uniref:biotin/lipoyl-containing protein n=1 Tax=Actinotalea ferrariae TaxID=1386098 RepID=UPI000557004B
MPRFEQFRLPDAGEGLTEAEVVLWHVGVGDRVAVNQPLVEIETAKSLVELPSPFEGVVTAILVEPGRTVDVGTPIITVDVDPDGAPAPEPAGDAAAEDAPLPDTPAAVGSGDTSAAQAPDHDRATDP